MKIPNKLPGSLAARKGGGNLALKGNAAYAYAIGGLQFLSAADRQLPIIRQTAPLRKEQYDNAQNPGEHSLSGWWLRSQLSFHGGAGQVFNDPSQTDPLADIRFASSRSVNVWNQGIVSLLHDVNEDTTGVGPVPIPGIVEMVSIQIDGSPAVFGITGAKTLLCTPTVTTLANWSTGTALSCVTDGVNLYVLSSTGLYKGPIPATVAGPITWTLMFANAVTGSGELGWVKQRLIMAVNGKIYEVAPNAVALPGTPLYTSINPITWTSVTETTSAIYVCGTYGTSSAVLKFLLDATGAIPTLTGAGVALQLPAGEIANSIFGYLGTYVGIGTNKGVRIATASANGDLSYGPLLFNNSAGSLTLHISDWTARDRFLWCTVSQGNQGDSGLYRIDLSTQVQPGRYAYATDLVAVQDTSNAVACAHFGGSDLICFATSANVYREDAVKVCRTGFLLTARIRFSTLEPKIFKLIRVRGPVQAGVLTVSVLDQGDHESISHSYPTTLTPGLYDAAITSPTEPQDYVSIKFTFNSNDAQTDGASLSAYQVKALPASPRQRLIQLPMLCYDWEIDRNGQRRGGNQQAWKRLRALEALEFTGNSVIWQEYDTGISRQVVIESVAYKQVAPPARFRGDGGLVTVTLRTID
ncbi:hypothetical protein [Longispora urticae]